MKEPEFKLFPWKMLAFAIPVLASGAALLAAQENRQETDVLAIAMAVLGAGNGYLLAAAIGDFGRSLIAIPVGASAGFVLTAAIEVRALCIVFFILLGFFLVRNILSEYETAPLRSIGCLGGTVLLGIALLPAFGTARDARVLGAFMLYPLVMSAVTTSMPARNTVGGRLAAMNAGMVASSYGMVAGFAGAFVAGIPLSLLGSVSMGRRGQPLMAVAGIVGAAIGNYICIKILFRAATRVSAPAPVEADTAEVSNEEPMNESTTDGK